jgi:ribonuclease inhibitor
VLVETSGKRVLQENVKLVDLGSHRLTIASRHGAIDLVTTFSLKHDTTVAVFDTIDFAPEPTPEQLDELKLPRDLKSTMTRAFKDKFPTLVLCPPPGRHLTAHCRHRTCVISCGKEPIADAGRQGRRGWATMTRLIVDCREIVSIEEFWDLYVSSIGAENALFFGRNLDALWDALEGGGPGCPPSTTHLIFRNVGELRNLKQRSGKSFLDELYELAGHVSRIKVETA